jgi:hypothetical protein
MLRLDPHQGGNTPRKEIHHMPRNQIGGNIFWAVSRKIIRNPVRDFSYPYRNLDVRVCVRRPSARAVANGSWVLAARGERLQAFLFDKAIQDAATECTVQ